MASEDIDFVTRGEFDHSVVEYAHGKPLEQIMGVSYRKDGKIVHNASRAAAAHRRAGCAAVCDRHLQARPEDREVQRAVSAASVRVVLHDARLPGAVHVLHVAADDFGACVADAVDGQRRPGSGKNTLEYFPQMKEIFFDDDTFNIRKDRAIELCRNSSR